MIKRVRAFCATSLSGVVFTVDLRPSTASRRRDGGDLAPQGKWCWTG